jgi:hypothetical protein
MAETGNEICGFWDKNATQTCSTTSKIHRQNKSEDFRILYGINQS